MKAVFPYPPAAFAQIEGDRVGCALALVCQFGVSLLQQLHQGPEAPDDLERKVKGAES